MKVPVAVGVLLFLFGISLLLTGCRKTGSAGKADVAASTVEQLPAGGAPTNSAGTAPVDGDIAAAAAVPPLSASAQSGATLPQSFAGMLAGIVDYKVVVSVTFDGRDGAGMPVSLQLVGTETVVHDPPGSRLDLSTRGGEQGQVGSVSMVSLGDAAYLYVPEIGCVSRDVEEFEDDMRLPVDPALLLEGLTGARMAASNVFVNGLEATEFHFDEASLPWSSTGPWNIDGALFVADSAAFVTRVAMTISGQGDILGDERVLDGEYNVVIDITKVAGDEVVLLPDACSGSSLYPMTPDAFEVTTIEDFLAYKSNMVLVDVVDYYLDEMPSAGWQLSSEPDVFEDLAIMNFERDGIPVMITVEFNADSGTVSVLISP